MSLTTSAQSLKKIFPSIIAFLVIMSLSFLIYFRYFYKTTQLNLTDPITISDLPQEVSSINTKTLTIEKNIPTSLDVFTSETPNDLTKSADILSSKLQMKDAKIRQITDSSRGVGVAYAAKDASLTVFGNSLSYQKIGKVDTAGNFNVETASARAIADLENLNLNTNLSANPQVSYQKILAETIIETNEPDSANVIKLSFQPQIGTFPIISDTPISISYNNTLELFSLRYTTNPTPISMDKYPIISAKQAIENLKKIKKPLYKISPLTDEIASTKTLPELDLKKASIAYYKPTKGQLIHPVWMFTGKIKLGNNIYETTSLVDALDIKYIKKN